MMAAVTSRDTRGEGGQIRATAPRPICWQKATIAASSLAPRTALAFEPTPIGDQSLITGVAPITKRDRLTFMMAAPLLPKRAQRAPDHGLFDLAARNQLDLFQPKDLGR